MKSETRDRLVQTARMQFWEHGYGGTGIAQILKAADAGSGSPYYFFPTKEDLLIAVLELYKELLWPEVVQPVFDRISDPIERIFGILEGYRRLLEGTDYADFERASTTRLPSVWARRTLERSHPNPSSLRPSRHRILP